MVTTSKKPPCEMCGEPVSDRVAEWVEGGENIAICSPFCAAEHRRAPQYPPSLTEPWAHQRRAMRLVQSCQGAGLWLDMGCGKSKVVVDYVQWLEAQKDRPTHTLIVCPKSVLDVWPTQFAAHAAGDMPCVIVLRKGSCAKKADQLLAEVAQKRPLVVIVNYESLWRAPLGETIVANVGWDTIVADESHRIKTPSAKASVYLFKLARRQPGAKRVALSGTPLPHSPMDAYAQYRFLDRRVFQPNKQLFMQRYAVMGGFEQREVVQWINQDDFTRRFRSISVSVRARDVLDLPPATDTTVWGDLEPKARKVYDQLKTDDVAALNETALIDLFADGARTASAANVLVKLLRLQQITGGSVKDDDGTVSQVSKAKAEMVAEWLGDLPADEPVVIFCRFVAELDAIQRIGAKAVGRRVLELSGRRNELAEWQAGEAPILAVQIQAGGVGVDMTRAQYCAYWSTGWSLGDYQQSRARVHRPGQTKPVFYYHFALRDTVDETIAKALSQRERLVARFEGRMT